MFIVFDLDGTLANVDHRAHILDAEHESEEAKWNAFFDACVGDTVYPEIAILFDNLAANHHIEIWTGRSDRVKPQTIRWLNVNLRTPTHDITMHMRKEGDVRADTEIKGEWVETYGKPNLVFDDSNRMVRWWRDQGVTCCQVKESDY